MIVEQRTYALHPGKAPEFLALYTAGPLALQRRILGDLIGYFTSEVGPLNQVVHLWGYASFEDRMARRAALLAEPEWREFLGRALPLLVSQESKLLIPTAFSPLGGTVSGGRD